MIKNRKKRILVFPCGSEIGLEVNRALSNDIHFEMYGASSLPDHGKFVFKNYIEGVPFVHFVRRDWTMLKLDDSIIHQHICPMLDAILFHDSLLALRWKLVLPLSMPVRHIMIPVVHARDDMRKMPCLHRSLSRDDFSSTDRTSVVLSLLGIPGMAAPISNFRVEHVDHL